MIDLEKALLILLFISESKIKTDPKLRRNPETLVGSTDCLQYVVVEASKSQSSPIFRDMHLVHKRDFRIVKNVIMLA